MWARLQLKSKPDSCTETCNVNMAEIRGEDSVLTRGGLTDVSGSEIPVRSKAYREKSAEAIVAPKGVKG